MIREMAFPIIHEEKSEKRDFLPSLFRKLGKYPGLRIYLEKGYGMKLGIAEDEYTNANPNVTFVSADEVFTKEAVIVVRVPKFERIRKMRRKAVLVSMLHYVTRPRLVELLDEKDILCFSMDSIVDDWFNRIFVNFPGTSGPAMRAGFAELGKRMPEFSSPARRPINATILGLGKTAQAAAKALENCSEPDFSRYGVSGIIVRMLPQSITSRHDLLGSILTDTDILVDCTKRSDPSAIIVPNRLLCSLPPHAVIVDVSSDPYDAGTIPPQVKAIEGIPYGTLDKYAFETDDPFYASIDPLVDTACRRTVVTCNAWPGSEPEECMRVYEEQLLPLIRVLLENDPGKISLESDDMYERALARSTLKFFHSN